MISSFQYQTSSIRRFSDLSKTIETAKVLARHGIQPVYLVEGSKAAAEPWAERKRLPSDREIESRASRLGGHLGLALINGPNAVCLDIEDRQDADRFASEHPEAVDRAWADHDTPSGGRHLIWKCSNLEPFRRMSRTGTALLNFKGRGEVRGERCLTAIPPTELPAGAYRSRKWSPESAIDIGDPEAFGLTRPFADCESANGTPFSHLSNLSLHGFPAHPVLQGEEEIIRSNLPSGPRQRRMKLLALARTLKAVPRFADKPATDLKELVRNWHRLAKPFIRTKDWETSWGDFVAAWRCVLYPIGNGPIDVMFAAASRSEPPRCASEYDTSAMKLLCGLLREMQRHYGEKPLPLDCRTAGRLLSIDHVTASRWLSVLCTDGVLELVAKGDHRKRRASEYRYLAGTDP